MSDATPQRPTSNEDRSEWKTYWAARGMPWRTEPEIDEERQRYLAERRAIQPDIAGGVYPFRDGQGAVKLSRADLEWLLATHEHDGKVGPIDWTDPKQRSRDGLDLRSADLAGADLHEMPLAGMLAGLTVREWSATLPEQRELASVNLRKAHLGAARLEGARLRYAHLEDAFLSAAHLEQAHLRAAHLEGASLFDAHLEGADLQRVFFDAVSNLRGVTLSNREFGSVRLVDARWDGANLAVIEWSQVKMLGDEQLARQDNTVGSMRKERRARRVNAYGEAVRANRQLSTVLRAQGLNEIADRYAYRAQRLQRTVLVRQGHIGRALGSWLLDATSGYGYKPLRSLIAYVLIILLFAGAYLLNAQFAAPHLTWDESLVLSISSFHGRGFFTSGISLGDTLARLAAGEAIIGLLIEITFIATFTQRFFAR